MDVGARELTELAQLGRRERGLHGPAAAEERDVADAAVAERVQRMVGDIGRSQLVVREREHARDVERHVAVADDDGVLDGQVELVVAMVGVAVVPPDEVGRGRDAGQLGARDAERPPDLRADRIDDGVVAGDEVVARDVPPDLEVAVPAEPRMRGDLLVDAGHRLDLRVVGRDARAHEAPGRRQPLEHVDLDRAVLGREEEAGGVEPGRPGADDGDAEGHFGSY